MKKPWSWIVGQVVLLAAALVGCQGGANLGDVEGEVTLNGAPLADGVIHFTPVDGQTPTHSGFIKSGRFAERLPVGKHRVEISSVQVQPLRPGQPADSAIGREIVPEKYNTQTELAAEVKSGKNTLKLELHSK